MFHDMSMLGAGISASPAPTDVYQALCDSTALCSASVANDRSKSFRAPGVWFDEGFDFCNPEGDTLTESVLDIIAAVETRGRQRREADAANHRTIVRKLLANGLRCFYYRNPSLVACQRKADSYKGKPQWLTGKAMARATDLLTKAGLIEMSVGECGTATTYSVTQDLLFTALEAGATERSLTHRLPSERLVRLYQANSNDGRLVDYQPTEETYHWTAMLGDYSAFLAQQDVALNLADGEAARLTARRNEWQAKGMPRLIRPELIQTDLYRQFNNGSFAEGGRLYGGWWIDTPKHLRNRITINGQATVELDYSGCALRMLYHERGIDYKNDPYSLEAIHQYEKKRGYRPGYYREALKKITQALINDRNGTHPERVPVGAGISFRPGFKRIDIRRMIEVKHAPIADVFRTGAGLRLQRLDSDLALSIITSLRKKGIVALPVHDSFITNYDNEEILKDTMINMYYDKFGFNPVIN